MPHKEVWVLVWWQWSGRGWTLKTKSATCNLHLSDCTETIPENSKTEAETPVRVVLGKWRLLASLGNWQGKEMNSGRICMKEANLDLISLTDIGFGERGIENSSFLQPQERVLGPSMASSWRPQKPEQRWSHLERRKGAEKTSGSCCLKLTGWFVS